MLAAPGIPAMLLRGRERAFLGEYLFPSLGGPIAGADLDVFVAAYAGPNGFDGAAGLYRSALTEGDELRALAAARRLGMPVLAVGGLTGPFTEQAMRAVADDVTAVTIDGGGHYLALQAPDRVAAALRAFLA